jgi:hypothetical protein
LLYAETRLDTTWTKQIKNLKKNNVLKITVGKAEANRTKKENIGHTRNLKPVTHGSE